MMDNLLHKLIKHKIESQDEFEAVQKSSIKSKDLRHKGNELYRRKHHDQEIHLRILSLYSKSIAFAQQNSEELALAYSNRSAVLLHFQRPHNALIDIDQALKITASTDLKTKLLLRKNKSLELINKSSNSEDNISSKHPLPTFVSSETHPCLAEYVKIKYNEKFGRHLIAARDIKPGEIIIAEKAYIAFPYEKNYYVVCSHCLTFAWNGIPCDFCAFAIFCSEECKTEAWKAYHDEECRIIPYYYDDSENKIFKATRLFIMAVKKEGLESVLHDVQTINNNNKKDVDDCTMFKSCYNLSSCNEINFHAIQTNFKSIKIISLLYRHTNILNDCKKSNFIGIEVRNEEEISVIKKIFVKLTNIMNTNDYGYEILSNKLQFSLVDKIQVQERLTSMSGSVLAPCCSFVNHSCYPNVERIFMPKRKIVLFSVFPIKKGEQLFCSYGPMIHEEKQGRQAYLQKKYQFTCECDACIYNWTISFIENQRCFNPLEKLDLKYSHERKLVIKVLKRLTKIIKHISDKMISVDTKFLKKVLTDTELLFKWFKNTDVFVSMTVEHKQFIREAFVKLYAEEFTIPNLC